MNDLTEFDQKLDVLDGLSDASLDVIMGKIGALTPWQGDPAGSLAGTGGQATDEDGFKLGILGEDFSYNGFQEWQQACWVKFHNNPFVFTSVMDTTGRLAGYGFEQASTYPKAHDFIQSTWKDPRNMLVQNFSKYIARSVIQGELFLILSIHKDGFVEIDFVSPSTIKGFENGSGILTPERKPTFPLLYRIEAKIAGKTETKYVPSINLAYYPDLWESTVKTHPQWRPDMLAQILGRDDDAKFEKIGNYTQFMIHFDQGLVTSRNVGRLKVTLKWLEHYDNIKMWELDHKKSSGAYLWTIEVVDRAAFRLWMAMSEEDRKKTGLMQKKVPGGTVMLPPGFKLTCNNPKLASITNQDDDILRMISAGINTSEDVMTGSSSGQTYGGVKMSRGPINDRIADQISDLEKFMVYTFWRGAMWLHSKTGNMNWTVAEERAYKFEGGEPKFKKVQVEAHETITINFPISEMGDMESKTKAMLGVKHGPLSQVLGISNMTVAKRLGFQNYHQNRLQLATEEKLYPKLTTDLEAEQMAEGVQEPNAGGQSRRSAGAEPAPAGPDPKQSDQPEKPAAKKPVKPTKPITQKVDKT